MTERAEPAVPDCPFCDATFTSHHARASHILHRHPDEVEWWNGQVFYDPEVTSHES